jgi:hypothetical protein
MGPLAFFFNTGRWTKSRHPVIPRSFTLEYAQISRSALTVGKLTFSQIMRKFMAIYMNRMNITTFKSHPTGPILIHNELSPDNYTHSP